MGKSPKPTVAQPTPTPDAGTTAGQPAPSTVPTPCKISLSA